MFVIWGNIKPKIASFHLNTECCFANTHTHAQEKLSYCRETARDAMLVTSCNVSRGVAAKTASNSKDDLQGHSRALTMVPFDRAHMISYKCSIVTMLLP